MKYLILTVDYYPLGKTEAENDEAVAASLNCELQDNADLGADLIHPQMGRLKLFAPDRMREIPNESALYDRLQEYMRMSPIRG